MWRCLAIALLLVGQSVAAAQPGGGQPGLNVSSGSLVIEGMSFAPSGVIDEGAVEMAIHATAPKLNACYARRPARPVGGRILAFVRSSRAGKVRVTDLGGSGDAVLERCIRRALARVRVGRQPSAAVIVVQLALLSSGSGDPGIAPRPSSVRLVHGATTVTGAVDKEIVRRIVRRDHSQFVACVENLFVSQPGARGTIALTIKVRGDGTVEGASATATPDSLALCVEDVARRMRLPASKDGKPGVASHQMTFEPS